jgi:tryptophan synthase alpha chain
LLRMSNRIRSKLSSSKNLLSLYVMADFPKAGITKDLCIWAESAGAGMLEIGMPFSDPIADGPTIQRCSEVALKNGFTIEGLFDQIKDIRQSVTIPILLMGYMNPVLQFGFNRFCEQAAKCGVDGVILPDLPLEEYLTQYAAIFKEHGLVNIFLVTSRTSEDRIKLLDSHSEGFIYLVSSEATTGGNLKADSNITDYFARVAALKLKNPCVVGFGISDYNSFKTACTHAQGAIVASAFLRRIEEQGASAHMVDAFVREIKGE